MCFPRGNRSLLPLQLWHQCSSFPACSIPVGATVPQPVCSAKAAPRRGLRPPAPRVWVWEGTGPKGDLAVGKWGEKHQDKEQLPHVLPWQWPSSIQPHSHLHRRNSSHVAHLPGWDTQGTFFCWYTRSQLCHPFPWPSAPATRLILPTRRVLTPSHPPFPLQGTSQRSQDFQTPPLMQVSLPPTALPRLFHCPRPSVEHTKDKTRYKVQPEVGEVDFPSLTTVPTHHS